MGFGGFYQGEKKKPKKHDLEKRKEMSSSFVVPQIEVIGKGKNKNK